MSTFVWKIPSTDSDTKQLICDGYIRQNCSKYIISPIIQILAKYYNAETFTLEDIKNAAWLQRFQSPIFSFGSFDCYIELYPNGSNKHNKANVMLYLCVVLMPYHIKQIFCSLKLSLQETNTSNSSSCSFAPKNWYHAVWNAGTLILAQIKDLNELTFTVEMTQIRVKLLNPITKEIERIEAKEASILLTPTPATYKWTISDKYTINKLLSAQQSEHFMSPFMSYGPFKWYFQIKPKHQRTGKPWIGFSIWYLPPNIVKFLCKIRIIFNDLTLLQFVYKELDSNTIIYGEMDEFPLLNEYSFMVDVAVIDILYDNDNIDRLELCKFDNIFRPIDMNKLLNFQYEWKINDNNKLKEIKNASNVFAFVSEIFEAYSLKWYISLSPNGSRTSRNNSVNIFLIMVSFPSILLKVPIKFELEWVESGKIFTAYHIYTIDLFCDGESIWPLQTVDIQNLNTFTIKVRVCIADIFKNNKSIIPKYRGNIIKPRNITVPSQTFKWFISKQNMNEIKLKMISIPKGYENTATMMDIFGMKWKFMLYPNGNKSETESYVVFMIHLVELPSITSIVCIRYTIFVKETNTRFVGEAAFRENNMISSWDSERILTDTFISFNELTMKIDMELIDIYDNNYRITNKFISNEYYHQLKQEENGNVEIMRLEMDELEYIINNLRILNKDNNDNEYVNQYNINSYHDELKNWFFNHIKMPQYYQQFVNAGINNLEMMLLLNKNDLINVGVVKTADITKILIEITLYPIC